MGRRSTIRLAARHGGITLADLMRARVVTMREAWVHLTEVEAAGRLARSGGNGSEPFRWTLIQNSGEG